MSNRVHGVGVALNDCLRYQLRSYFSDKRALQIRKLTFHTDLLKFGKKIIKILSL